MAYLIGMVTAALVAIAGWFVTEEVQAPPAAPSAPQEVSYSEAAYGIAATEASDAPVASTTIEAPKATSTPVAAASPTWNGLKVLSKADLLALADDKYASGGLPIGDGKYVTDKAQKGYIYLCNARASENPGAMTQGGWVHGSTWNPSEKISVQGSVSWPSATFSASVSGSTRTLSGNGLPVGHSTGIFPVQSSDPAYKIDRNPNSISAQTLAKSLPADPAYSATPYCMGGEVGVMLTGIPLFNGFDAGLRDAQAWEVQDSCDGHPQGSGQYHYHGKSSCFKDEAVSTVLGYAYDGFPITGPKVAEGEYLTTEDLDECHGIVSEVVMDGMPKATYHYVLTEDFPYSASCFRGKPISTGPSAGQTAPSGMQSGPQGGQMPGQRMPPPRP